MSAEPYFEGHNPRECSEHRTVGTHRAWCYDCHEWCYPKSPCKGCELGAIRDHTSPLLPLLDEIEAASKDYTPGIAYDTRWYEWTLKLASICRKAFAPPNDELA